MLCLIRVHVDFAIGGRCDWKLISTRGRRVIGGNEGDLFGPLDLTRDGGKGKRGVHGRQVVL